MLTIYRILSGIFQEDGAIIDRQLAFRFHVPKSITLVILSRSRGGSKANGFPVKVGAALTLFVGLVGAAAGLHSIWAYYDERALTEARLEIVDSRATGSKVELKLRNPGTTSVFVNKAAFFISKHQKIGFGIPSTTGPVPIPALYQVTFPLQARPDTAVEVYTSFNIAGGDSGAFSIEVKVRPVSRGQDRATHVYEAVVVLFYNGENKVSSAPFTVRSSTSLRSGMGNPLKPVGVAAPIPGEVRKPSGQP